MIRSGSEAAGTGICSHTTILSGVGAGAIMADRTIMVILTVLGMALYTWEAVDSATIWSTLRASRHSLQEAIAAPATPSVAAAMTEAAGWRLLPALTITLLGEFPESPTAAPVRAQAQVQVPAGHTARQLQVHIPAQGQCLPAGEALRLHREAIQAAGQAPHTAEEAHPAAARHTAEAALHVAARHTAEAVPVAVRHPAVADAAVVAAAVADNSGIRSNPCHSSNRSKL